MARGGGRAEEQEQAVRGSRLEEVFIAFALSARGGRSRALRDEELRPGSAFHDARCALSARGPVLLLLRLLFTV